MTEDTASIKTEETIPRLSSTATASQEEFRPLNVKDALGYLDKVKAKFAAQSEIYNQFLDIMKDFKSQMIDTLGVIERVSTLFRGHPALISGFNTFLPPGYCIDCSVDEQKRNIIKVTTPSGITTIKDTEDLNLRGDMTSKSQQSEEQKPPVEFNHAITYVNRVKGHFSNTPEVYKKFLEILQTYQKDQKPIEEVYTEVQVLFDNSNDLLDEFKQFLPDPKQRKKRLGNVPSLNISKKSKLHHPTDIQTSDIRSQPSNDDDEKVSIENSGFSRPTFSAEEAAFFEKVKTYIGNKATYNAFLKVLNLFSQQIVDQEVLVNRVESFIGGNPELFDLFKMLVGYDGKASEMVQAPYVSNQKRGSTSVQDCGPSYRHISKVWENRTCSGRDGLCWDVLNDTYISHPTWASEDTGFVAAKKNQYEEALHRVEEERYDYDLNIEANLNTIALLEPIAKKISIMSAEEKTSFRLSPGLGSPSQTIYQRIMKKIYGPQKGLEMIDLLHNNPAQTVPIVLRRLKQKDDEWKRAQREWNKIWREVERKNYWKSLDYQGIQFKVTDRKCMTTRLLVSQAESLRAQQSQPHDTSSKKLRMIPQFIFPFTDLSVFKDVARLLYFYLDRQPVYNPEDCTSMREFLNTMIPMFFEVHDVEPSTIEDIGDIVRDDVADDDVLSVQSDDTKSTSTPTRTSKKPSRRGRNPLNDVDVRLKDVLTRNINSSKKKKGSRSTSSDDDDDEDEDDDEEEDESGSQTNGLMDVDEDEENEGGDEDEDDDEDEEEDDENDGGDEDEEEEEMNRSGRPRRRATRTSNRRHREAMKKSQRNRNKKSNGLNNPKVATLASLIEKGKPMDSALLNRTYNFFGDNGFYCFFRLYQILYERLYKMKILDMEFRNSPEKVRKAREEARDLGITPKRFKALKMNTQRGTYNILLSLIDKLFEGEIDQQTFEESVRYIFGTDAYIMFTIDKLVLSIVRHIHIIIADNQSQELYELFKEMNQAERNDQSDINAYIDRASEIIDSAENIYYINFKLKTRTLGIQLIDGNVSSPTINEESSNEYDTYVTNYIDWSNETKGIDQTALTSRFLKRNLKHKGTQSKDVVVQSGMQYKICRDTYHMFYIIGTEDAFVRRQKKNSNSSSNNTKWTHWVNEQWCQGLTFEEKQRAENEAIAMFK